MLERFLCRAHGSRAPLHLETLPSILELSAIEFEDHDVFFHHVLDQHILIVGSKGDTLRPVTDGRFSEPGSFFCSTRYDTSMILVNGESLSSRSA